MVAANDKTLFIFYRIILSRGLIILNFEILYDDNEDMFIVATDSNMSMTA